jgi:hypothetical protein
VIIEQSKRDRYWGNGGDDTWLNWLGRILMEVREEIKAAERVQNVQEEVKAKDIVT